MKINWFSEIDDELDANDLSAQFDLNYESDENDQEEYINGISAKQIDNIGTSSMKTIGRWWKRYTKKLKLKLNLIQFL